MKNMEVTLKLQRPLKIVKINLLIKKVEVQFNLLMNQIRSNTMNNSKKMKMVRKVALLALMVWKNK